MNISTKQIGDGKLPNKYWVSISNDYLVYNEEVKAYDWISDKNLFKANGDTLGVFKTFVDALQFAEELPFGEKFDGIRINMWSIEDRISGQIAERVKFFNPEIGLMCEQQHDDTEFTRKTMAKKGAEFV